MLIPLGEYMHRTDSLGAGIWGRARLEWTKDTERCEFRENKSRLHFVKEEPSKREA